MDLLFTLLGACSLVYAIGLALWVDRGEAGDLALEPWRAAASAASVPSPPAASPPRLRLVVPGGE